MTMPLRVESISHVYQSNGAEPVVALQDVSLHVEQGTFTSIIGPSGSGKSSLLRILAGLNTASSGDTWIGDRRVTDPSRDIGFVFQEQSLLPWRDLLSNVAFGLEVAGVSKGERHATAREFLRLVGLETFESALPGQLSGGMQQRAAIARTLAMRPPVMLMDEPFGALDEQTRLLMGSELSRIWEATGTTIVLVTHSIQEAVLLSDQVAVLTCRPGRVKSIHAVDLPRPRLDDMIATPEFQRIQANLWEDLRAEAKFALGAEAVREG
jgi:NitT/TauT family transport system ATP-binding protein